ncbi:hypothetical protein [Pontiella sulfatireligans]|uniref:Uncharacterized protein n=1 Tax=Pontiella sulfatireligans TaxID=2750658 RepID=A0A6C2UNG1_9BACT|nr:hypothetical protein [Pontiella sulfatireligans]VGO21802.1 hypothetical protein SCARR_03879 [Pontiella sulfatireligans]
MEDFVGLLVFVVIAVVQLLKYLAGKAGKNKPAPKQGEAATKRAPSSIEEFFEKLAEKLEPQPTEQPDWPEGYERPDYVHEMEEFEQDQAEEFYEEPAPEPAPMPKPLEPSLPPIQGVEKVVAFQAPPQVASSVFASSSIRIPTIPMMRNNAGGVIDFDFKSRKKLKQAIIANLIFSPPRAYDASFENTLAK